MKFSQSLTILMTFTLACGPSQRQPGDDMGDDTGGPDAFVCYPVAEISPADCSDQIDNDCDGLTDCSDQDCSGIGECPICGEVDTDEPTAIVLPDGIVGTSCSTDADCTSATPNCVENECHDSYTSTLNVIGFGQNQTFNDPSIIESVCATMEHSWLRDIEIRLIAPGGQIVRLQKFLGRTGGEVYLGQANDCDEGNPVMGTGDTYCWKPMATNPPMLDFANAGSGMASAASCHGGTASKLPPGDFKPADPFTGFMGSPLNGQWKFVVTDLWPVDNGFLFSWTIKFNADSVPDCSGPIIL
jgi:hypothetical protein